MDDVPEILYICDNTTRVLSLRNGACVRILDKGKKRITQKTLTPIGHDYLIAAVENEPRLKVITVSGKLDESAEFTVPGIVTALAATSCGEYCFGAIGTSLYAWKVCNGDLLAVVSKHYQEITCIKLSSDDSHVLTGGQDGHVNVWMLVDLVSPNFPADAKKTRFTWTDHSSDIMDIHLTPFSQNSRVATVSSDSTCRLYELNTGALITTVILDVNPTAVTMDVLECFLFIGDELGALHRINIFERLPREMSNGETNRSKIQIHESKILSLNMAFEGTKLVSADCNSVRLWDVQSFSCILRIEGDSGPITNAFVSLEPATLTDDTLRPLFNMVHFQRSFDENARPKPVSVKTGKTTLSAMPRILSDMCYSASSEDSIVQNTTTDQIKQKGQDDFIAIVNGKSIAEMIHTNNQLYSTALHLSLEAIGDRNDLETDATSMIEE